MQLPAEAGLLVQPGQATRKDLLKTTPFLSVKIAQMGEKSRDFKDHLRSKKVTFLLRHRDDCPLDDEGGADKGDYDIENKMRLKNVTMIATIRTMTMLQR